MREKYWIFNPENAQQYHAGKDILTIHFERFSDDRAMLRWLVRETWIPIPEEGVGTLEWIQRVQQVFDEHLPGWLMIVTHATPTK
ncbi:MAG TPA: hypothetical protein VJH67_00330 [Candidatus Paceibacterota bacterium]